MKMSKRGFQLESIPSIAMVFVIIAIVLSVGATILAQMQTTQTSGSTAYNLTGTGTSALVSLGNWVPVFVIVVCAAVVLGIVMTYLYFRSK